MLPRRGAPILFAVAVLLAAATVPVIPAARAQDAADRYVTPVLPVDAPEPASQGRSVRLHRMTSGFLPADGILSAGFSADMYTIEYGEFRAPLDFLDAAFELEYGLFPWLRFHGRVPTRSWSGGGEERPDGSGTGDADVSAIWRLPSPWPSLGVALDAGATLPTGDEQAGLGEGEEAPHLTLAISRRFFVDSIYPEIRLHLNVGRRWNRAEGGRFAGAGGIFAPWYPLYPAADDAGDNDFLLLGAAIEMRKGITSLFAEYTEARLDDAPDVAASEFDRNLTMGLRWGRDTGMALNAAVDVSIAKDDFGTAFEADYPDIVYRFGLSYALPVGGRDRDHDGIPDREDRCPTAPEDFDGFEDEDGCPEWDNDGDGVPDATDRAPLLPEDIDGFRDDDGLPDPDNDRDGIPDAVDNCPDQAEDFDGYKDQDGCPEDFLDRDGDGVADEDDDCPDRAEDFDGFQDEDGCPELDNDLDGIADADDACPDLPEDYDGIEDGDGCPDPMPAAAGEDGGAGGADDGGGD